MFNGKLCRNGVAAADGADSAVRGRGRGRGGGRGGPFGVFQTGKGAGKVVTLATTPRDGSGCRYRGGLRFELCVCMPCSCLSAASGSVG